ncbi:NAD(P)/FAD-dependent oxidoreductase [Nocardioides sp. MAHUQ-72]|uniref:NAD(P)/FAD-dependent oxidoreductase n=1 Tax=unclassified Nocardioides TaxID=2615069 RepID=UPI0036238DA9
MSTPGRGRAYDAAYDAAYDVVVVGARVAGASTAMLLARAGARVLVLDRSAYGSDTLSTHGLMRAGVLQLSRWGLLDRIVEAGTPAVRSTTFRSVGLEPVHVTIRPSEGVEALYAPRRHLLDRVLVDAALESGAEVRHGVRVTGLLRDGSGRVAGVRAVDRSGRESAVRARHVVGADGIRSVVADAAGSAVLRRGRHASAVRYAYVEGLDAAGYEWAYGDGAGAGFIPTGDGLHCVFAATTPERLRTLRLGERDDAGFLATFRLAAPDQVERLGDARRVGRLHGWAGAPGHLRQPWGPGWALVGDAGYFKDPISTHGMTDALRDAELAARALLEVLGGGRSERAALGEYHRRRDAVSHRLFEVADEISSYHWDGAGVQPLLRRMSAAMTDEVELLASLPTAPRREVAGGLVG